MNALLRKLHNPRGRTCGCDADCWCRTNPLGRAVRWWFPARYFGIQHKRRALLPQWQHAQPQGDPRTWKRAQDERRKRDSDAEP